MLLVVEVPEETQAVELVIRIGVVQLLQELQLLEPRLLPEDQENPVRTSPLPHPDSYSVSVTSGLTDRLLTPHLADLDINLVQYGFYRDATLA